MHRATPFSQSWDLCSHSVFFTIEEIFHTLLIFLMPLTCPQSCNYLCCHQWILDLVVEPYDFSSLLPFLSLCFSVSCSLISCCQTLKSDRKKKKSDSQNDNLAQSLSLQFSSKKWSDLTITVSEDKKAILIKEGKSLLQLQSGDCFSLKWLQPDINELLITFIQLECGQNGCDSVC